MSRLAISIAFPSGRPHRPKVERALSWLRAWPVDVRCPLLEQDRRWTSRPDYLAGDDEERAEEMLGLWRAGNSPVIWCGRGGYGATRILGRLEAGLAGGAVGPARLYGYSDITALFALIRVHRLPIASVHFPVLTELPDHPAPEVLLRALQNQPCPLPLSHREGSPAFEGPIWGGNLAVLASLCGTPWLPRIDDGAIFLEDIDEAPYRLDRFLTQLFDSGFFASTHRVVLGQFTRCGQDGSGLRAVKQRIGELGLELLGEIPVGHEAHHLPLFLDQSYRFDPASEMLQPVATSLASPQVACGSFHQEG